MADHSGMKLGKKPPKVDAKRLKLGRYLLPGMLPAPSSQDWVGAITDWGMMLNNELGDCVFAGIGHAIQTWSANNSGTEVTVPDSGILSAYELWAGYDPANPDTDQGAFEVDVLNRWRQEGFQGHALRAYADPDPGNIEHVKQAITIFGGVYLGLALPTSAQSEDVWADTSGEPGTWGGHCVWVPRYDSDGPTCVTWGELKRMTWDWFVKYCDEAHALMSDDFLRPSNFSASGFDLGQLEADLQALSV
jgi:hypothetical protein